MSEKIKTSPVDIIFPVNRIPHMNRLREAVTSWKKSIQSDDEYMPFDGLHYLLPVASTIFNLALGFQIFQMVTDGKPIEGHVFETGAKALGIILIGVISELKFRHEFALYSTWKENSFAEYTKSK